MAVRCGEKNPLVWVYVEERLSYEDPHGIAAGFESEPVPGESHSAELPCTLAPQRHDPP